MAKILVTGVNGFVGQHLALELKVNGHEVVGLGHSGPADPSIADVLTAYYRCDLTNHEEVALLELKGIDAVINLAGLANPGNSFKNPQHYMKVNVEVFTNLANSFITQNASARIIAISTGAAYDPQQPMPLDENSKTTNKGSPYAMSKLAMEDAAQGFRAKGLDCLIARPFNHIGPGQEPGFLVPDLYAKILGARNKAEPIRVGKLETKRDYTDVRDVVKAYAALALAPTLEHGIYNVCSGVSRTGMSILELLLETTGQKGQLEVEIDESLVRPNDPPDLRGSYERLSQELGWQPTIQFEQTVRDFVAWKESSP